jgi:glutathione S-transferase
LIAARRGETVASMQFVDLETARQRKGLRLVVVAGVPSPWSQAAKAIFDLKGIDAVAVRLQLGDKEVPAWTGVHNAPVALHDDEPPRSGWAEILALAERLRPDLPLVPSDPRERALMHGLSHELLGEGGLIWCMRLCALDASFASDGKQAYPIPVARYLAARYGYAPGRAEPAGNRMLEILRLLDDALQRSRATGHTYFMGGRLSALDIYSAACLDALAPLPHASCPMHPVARAALEWTHGELRSVLPPALLEHRDMMHARHMPLPMEL